MHDRPSARELVGAVRDFLENHAMPALEGHTAFHARVAVNALAIVERELELAPGQDAEELERLRAWLPDAPSLDAANRQLCRQIRAGELGAATPGLLAHLRETTLAKLSVDQPKYSGYRRATSARATGLS